MKTYKAAIFDLDGTIIDSNSIWEKIDKKILDEHNITVSDEEMQKLVIMNFDEIIDKFHSIGIKESYEELMKKFNDYAVYEYKHNIFLKDYVWEYFDKLKNANVKIGLATASPKKYYEPVLRHNNVYSCFDVICTIDEVSRNKDYPDIYLLCASNLGIAPEDCVVFEDILSGIKSAKSVGMGTVGVYDKYSEDQMCEIKSVADKYIYNFLELL